VVIPDPISTANSSDVPIITASVNPLTRNITKSKLEGRYFHI
jgi:hypothetical protein